MVNLCLEVATRYATNHSAVKPCVPERAHVHCHVAIVINLKCNRIHVCFKKALIQGQCHAVIFADGLFFLTFLIEFVVFLQ